MVSIFLNVQRLKMADINMKPVFFTREPFYYNQFPSLLFRTYALFINPKNIPVYLENMLPIAKHTGKQCQ